MTRTSQILLLLGACGLIACGGDDDGIIIADSGPTADSGPDANLCGDYSEASDATNDTLASETGMAEASGISFAAGDTRTVCGVVDPAQAIEAVGTVDIDAFDFEIAEGTAPRVVLRSDGADQVGGLVVLLQVVDQNGQGHTLSGGGYAGGYALATTGQQIAGPWRLVVIAFAGDTPPAASFDYQLEISERPACDAAAGDADYTEAKDGAKSRRNDTVSVDWNADTSFTLTRSTTDLPEPTGLTLEAGTPVHLHGTSARIAENDSYADKDAYALTVGEGINELDIRLSWAADTGADLDALAFLATMPEAELTGGNAAFGSTMPDDVGTARTPGGADVWLWVGAYAGSTDLPQQYDITICPRAFTP